MYLDYETYLTLPVEHTIKAEDWPIAEAKAEQDVDSATFNRICDKGFDNLTQYQQEQIQLAIANHANFITAYGDYINNPLSSYAINGVSMAWDGKNLAQIGDVPTTAAVRNLLVSTGLAYRGCV